MKIVSGFLKHNFGSTTLPSALHISAALYGSCIREEQIVALYTFSISFYLYDRCRLWSTHTIHYLGLSAAATFIVLFRNISARKQKI
jgi:hypothetical protein